MGSFSVFEPLESDRIDQSDTDSTELYSEDETVIFSDDQSLRILSINVGGLRSKVESPDFENFIITYDIVCIIETHFDIFDSISINGFKLLPTMVRRNAKSRSGGIAILVRESIFDSRLLKIAVRIFIGFLVLVVQIFYFVFLTFRLKAALIVI